MPAPSAVFVDRKELLAEFAVFSKQTSSAVRARTFVIYGPSGFGKSRAAFACVERQFERYDFIWLLDAGDPAGEFQVVVPRRQGVEYEVDHQVTADGS